MLDALRAGEADVALPVVATPERAAEFLLTAPVHLTNLAVAELRRTVVGGVLRGMLAWESLWLVLGLSALLLFVGALVWLMEQR